MSQYVLFLFSFFFFESKIADPNGRVDSVVIGRNHVNTVGVISLPAIFSSIENKDRIRYLVCWDTVKE